MTTTSEPQTSAASRGDLRAGLDVGGVGQQRVRARAVLHDDLQALGLQLAHDLRHKRHPVLARRGLLRNTDPHVQGGNVSDRDAMGGGPGCARLERAIGEQ